MNKEQYIDYANKTFNGKALDIVLNQIELFYKNNVNIKKNSYATNEDVNLSKGTFLHGIPNNVESFEWIVENGFISSDFSDTATNTNKIKNSSVYGI